TVTLVIRRLTVFFLPMVVVVFLTAIVTCTSPQGLALPGTPVNFFVAVATFFFGTVLVVVVAAHAFALGSASAMTLTTTVAPLRTCFSPLFHWASANRSVW